MVKQELGTSLETATALCDEVGWCCKFRKLKSGLLTVSGAQALQRQCAGAVQEVVDLAKSLRSLMPKAEKDKKD